MGLRDGVSFREAICPQTWRNRYILRHVWPPKGGCQPLRRCPIVRSGAAKYCAMLWFYKEQATLFP